MKEDETVEAVVSAVKESRKYAGAHEETIRTLAAEAVAQHKKPKLAVKAVRKRLHGIMAPYLGDPDYETAAAQLTAAYQSGDEKQIRAACWHSLYAHLSTRERLPIMEQFYHQVFQVTGRPERILDVACGLNPLAFPWMGLPTTISYYAYDIHEPRITFLNQFFALQGLPLLARLQDVALHFPEEEGDVALFLKELPRFERNYGGLGRSLMEALRVRYLVVSFPTVSTHGGRNLTERYRSFLRELTATTPWSIVEILFEGELVFCIDKEHGS